MRSPGWWKSAAPSDGFEKAARAEPNPNQVLEQWVGEVRRIYAEMSRAQREAGGKETEALRAAQEKRRQLWEPMQASKPIEILQAAAVEPRLAQAAPFSWRWPSTNWPSGQCCRRNARRKQRFGRQPPNGGENTSTITQPVPRLADARLHLARALVAQGEREAALQLLQAPPTHFSPWQKRACTIRANQLREQK